MSDRVTAEASECCMIDLYEYPYTCCHKLKIQALEDKKYSVLLLQNLYLDWGGKGINWLPGNNFQHFLFWFYSKTHRVNFHVHTV
jgi:hypothetical protein